jgi:hypothetical protein
MVGLPTGVIQQFLHPPVGLLTRELIAPALTGAGTLTRTRGPVGVDAFGIEISFFTIPAAFGRVLGAVDRFENRIIQLTVQHTLVDGHLVDTEVFDVYSEGIILFTESLPTSIAFDVTVGCTVIGHWLLVI